MFEGNLLLNTESAKELFHQVAKQLPVIDYHNHLSPASMASDRKFSNITELWIHDDQYKHRLMRINGVAEKFITGEGTDEEKFLSWMKTYPSTLGNPLYHWSQLELQDIFDVDISSFKNEPQKIWSACNKRLGSAGLGAIDILKKWNVEIMCTSDELLDDLQFHQQATTQHKGLSVYPSLRADSIIAFDSPGFLAWMEKLALKTGVAIIDLESYQHALRKRLDVFEKAGCALSDHGLDSGFSFELPSESDAQMYFERVLKKEGLSTRELTQLQSLLLRFLGIEYGKRKLTMQLHIGAQRTTSSRLHGIAGKFGGFATIGNAADVVSLCKFLNVLEEAGALPHTILYTLNPVDNERMATLTGSFTSDGTKGKIQFGPAWWFNDHLDGIRRQLTDVAAFGLLSTFIGMTSDSRSFLSLSRHYYFRRILCNLLGTWVAEGLIPSDFDTLSALVKNICYNNAKNLITKRNIL